MLVVLIKCPRTGHYLSAGINTSAECFEQLAEPQPPVNCPFCSRDHFWTKRDAILVPPDRWSAIPEVQACLMKAMESAEQAAAALNDVDRQLHLRAERKWLGLASGYRLLFERHFARQADAG
jgi:hypothetical protein